jgi:hypothetical protein
MRRLQPILAAALALGAAPAAAQPAAPPPAPAQPLQPGPEQLALGRRMAAAGDFNAIVGAMGEAEIDRMARETPNLTEAERDRLRAVGEAELAVGRAHILDAVAIVYARHFTLEQLRAITQFLESDTGRAYTGAIPTLLPEVAAALQGMDFGAAVRRSFCRETGKLCAAH